MSQINTALPIRSTELTENPTARAATIKAIIDLYTFFTRLPYIPASALMLPPSTGWTTIDEDELRAQGKSESVISLLRELPYLDTDDRFEWQVGRNTRHINYAKGELPDEILEFSQLWVPSHVVWLSFGVERGGCYWLLDTHTWEVTEFTSMYESLQCEFWEYEILPEEEQWRCYARMPASRYFDLWRWKLETLEWMVVPELNEYAEDEQFFEKDPVFLWEDGLEETDDEDGDFVPEDCGDEDDDSSISASEDSEDDMEWEMVEDINELEWLHKDVEENPFPSNEANEQSDGRIDKLHQFYGTTACSRSVLFSNGPFGPFGRKPSSKTWNDTYRIEERKDVRELASIYYRHGWPKPAEPQTVAFIRHPPAVNRTLNLDSFDREACLNELHEWTYVRRRYHQYNDPSRWKGGDVTRAKVIATGQQFRKDLLSLGVPPYKWTLAKMSRTLDKLEPLDQTHAVWLNETWIYGLLKKVVNLQWLQEDDRYHVVSKARRLFDKWVELGMIPQDQDERISWDADQD